MYFSIFLCTAQSLHFKIFFSFQLCSLTLSFQYVFHVHTELTFFQSDVNQEYRNGYAGLQQGLHLSSATPSDKCYLVFVLCSFHYYRQIVSSCVKITLYGETQTVPKYEFTAVKLFIHTGWFSISHLETSPRFSTWHQYARSCANR